MERGEQATDWCKTGKMTRRVVVGYAGTRMESQKGNGWTEGEREGT